MTVLVSDSFNRANSTTGLGTTDSYNGGTATTWQAITGTLGISSNQAYIVTTATNDNIAVVDSGQSDVTITVTDVTDGSKIGSIYARVVDSNNWIRLAKVNTGSGALYLQTKLNGTVTTIATATSLTMANNDVLKLTLQGNSITAYLNGTSVITATNSNNQTATKHGIGTQGSGSVTFDNFEVDSLTSGTSVTVTTVIANANASSLAPTVATSSSVSISSVITSAQADALAPQVGTFRNINISAIATNATAGAINPSTSTTSNISLGAPISNAVASALIPNVGLSTSANIAAVIASLVVDGIAPNITTTQGTMINSIVAGANASAVSPTLQRDLVIYSVVANSQASALSPNINGKLLVSKIYLNANRSLTINLKANQSKQVNLKGAIT